MLTLTRELTTTLQRPLYLNSSDVHNKLKWIKSRNTRRLGLSVLIVCALAGILCVGSHLSSTSSPPGTNRVLIPEYYEERRSAHTLSSTRRVHEQDVAFVTPCDQAAARDLCWYKEGALSPIPLEAFSGPKLSCISNITDGHSLRALSLESRRVMVFPDATLMKISDKDLAALRNELQALPHATVCQGTGAGGAWLSDKCWSAEPKQLAVFETACSSVGNLNHKTNVTLLDFLNFAKFGFARFPTNKFNFEGTTVSLKETSKIYVKNEVDDKYAFVTYLSSTHHDWYVEAVRMIWGNMNMHCDELYDFVVMILRPNVQNEANITRFAQLLVEEGMKIVYVDDIITNFNRDGRFTGIWGKQKFWNLTSYAKVAFIDPDQVLLKCPNSILKYPAWTHAAVGLTFNSGVLIATPSMAIMNKVESLVRESGERNDQTLTEKYFAGRGYVIPEYWSFYKRHSYRHVREWETWKHCSTFIHFTGEKPWEKIVPGTERSVGTFFESYLQFKKIRPDGPSMKGTAVAGTEAVQPSLCP